MLSNMKKKIKSKKVEKKDFIQISNGLNNNKIHIHMHKKKTLTYKKNREPKSFNNKCWQDL